MAAAEPAQNGADQKQTSGAKGAGARAQLSAWARTALPVVASAIGISGLVSILGASVLWVRFSAAHVPPEQAVGDLPASSLLATGAVTLILYMVLGLIAVLAAYMLQGAVLSQLLGDREPEDRAAYEKVMGRSAAVRNAWDAVEIARSADPMKSLKRENKVIRDRLGEVRAQISQSEKDAAAAPKKSAASEGGPAAPPGRTGHEPAGPGDAAASAAADRVGHLRRQQIELVAQADVVSWRIHDWRQRKARGEGVGRGGWGLVALVGAEVILVFARTDVGLEWKIFAWLLVVGLALVAVDFEQTRLGRRPAAERTPRARVKSLWGKVLDREGATLALLGAGVLLLAVSVYIIVEETWIVIPMLVSLALAAVIWAVGRLHPRRFFWYGIAVFVSVLLFGATLTYSRTFNQPTAQAAAVLLKNGCVARGLWVGENSERVFLAFVPIRRAGGTRKLGKGHVFWLIRKQVVSETVGSLTHVVDAERESRHLRSQAWRLSRVLAPGSAACRPSTTARNAETAEEEEGPPPGKKETVANEAEKEDAQDKAQEQEEKEHEQQKKKLEEQEKEQQEAKKLKEEAKKNHEEEKRCKEARARRARERWHKHAWKTSWGGGQKQRGVGP